MGNSNSSNTGAQAGGVSTITVVGIVLVILKLCGVINWSWVWVLAPFWIPVILVIFIFGVVAIWAILRKGK